MLIMEDYLTKKLIIEGNSEIRQNKNTPETNVEEDKLKLPIESPEVFRTDKTKVKEPVIPFIRWKELKVLFISLELLFLLYQSFMMMNYQKKQEERYG